MIQSPLVSKQVIIRQNILPMSWGQAWVFLQLTLIFYGELSLLFKISLSSCLFDPQRLVPEWPTVLAFCHCDKISKRSDWGGGNFHCCSWILQFHTMANCSICPMAYVGHDLIARITWWGGNIHPVASRNREEREAGAGWQSSLQERTANDLTSFR